MFSFTNGHGFRVCTSIPYTAMTVMIYLLTRAAADAKSGFHILGSRFVTNDVFNSAVAPNGGVNLSLNDIGGSGFESLKDYSFGTFTMEMKLMSGFSAGVCATFFLQQGDKYNRTEWDFEFLGSATNGRGINIQTNYWQNGVGAHEVRFLPSFDPSAGYHRYTVDWQKLRTQFLIDGNVVRTVENVGGHYPVSPFRVYGSIWNASDWATGSYNHRIPIDYAYQPWTVVFKHFSYTQATSKPVYKIKEDGKYFQAGLTLHALRWHCNQGSISTASTVKRIDVGRLPCHSEFLKEIIPDDEFAAFCGDLLYRQISDI